MKNPSAEWPTLSKTKCERVGHPRLAERARACHPPGFFVLGAEDEGAADSLQKQAEGLSVTVRYNPETPDVSLLVDDEVQGRKISQNPHWFP